MRLPQVTVCVAVAACLVLAFNVDLAEAKRKRKACKYNKRERIESECDPTTNSMKVTFNLKKGKAKCPPTKTLIKPCGDAAAADCKYRRDGKGSVCDPVTHTKLVSQKLKDGPETCPPTRLISKPCRKNMGKKRKNRKNNKIKGCRYDRSGAEWGPCEETTGVKRKEMPVVKGSKPDCPPTKTRTKPCGKSKKKWKKQRKGCVYSKQPWSECDVSTNTRQREMVLMNGDPTLCLPKKIVTKKCRKVCRFTKGEWGPCDTDTGVKSRTQTPKPGSPTQCQATVQTKPCSRQAELIGPKLNKCKYTFGPWSSCDQRTNTMSRQMSLKSGDPNVCQRSKNLTKKCRVACKFRRGNWTECDEQTHLMTRVDTLFRGKVGDCELNRQITKKCKTNLCKYSLGDWSECDPATNVRSRVKTLLKGDQENCKASDTVTRSCTKTNGRARCFYGLWGEFGPCTNGVMTKQRQLIQGGMECERKAVITKACDDTSD